MTAGISLEISCGLFRDFPRIHVGIPLGKPLKNFAGIPAGNLDSIPLAIHAVISPWISPDIYFAGIFSGIPIKFC